MNKCAVDNQKGLISVVMPTYNGEHYIAQAIESILNQTYKKFELIIVNDCSTDNTLSVIEKYTKVDGRIRIVNNPVNRKLPASLNIGFSHAKGEYYTWTSDDNYYGPDAFLKMLNFLQYHHDIQFVFSDYFVVDEKGTIVSKKECINQSVEEVLCKNVIGACFLYSSVLHTELNGYDENQFLVEDYDFWLRAYQRYRFGHIGEPLYYYRIHKASLTSMRESEINERTIALLERNLREQQCSREVKAKIALVIMERYCKTNDRKYGRRYLKRAYQYSIKIALCEPISRQLRTILKNETVDRLLGRKAHE